MMPRGLLLASLALAGLVGCGSCGSCGQRPLAELVQMHGNVGVSRSASPSHFTGASVGTDFALGDAVRTGAEATAKLRLDDGNELSMRPSTTIRFSATRPGSRGRRLELLAGEATLTVIEDTLLDTGEGSLWTRAGSRLRLRRADGELELVVLVGRARLETEGREPVEISVGTAFVLEPRSASAAATSTSLDAPEEQARLADETPHTAEHPIEMGANLRADRTDFALPAGDSLVLRDPAPPTAIGIDVSSACPGQALVQVFDGPRLLGSARGSGTIPVTFQEGALTYRVRCNTDGAIGEPTVEARVRVLRATGQAPLPRSAPVSNVEADGRTYQILYSNRLPSVNVRWPNGPAGSCTLVLDGSRRIEVNGPRHRFTSGSLSEGTHRIHFESGGRRSRDTNIVIRFDPVAAAASLDSPADGSFAPGEVVRVSGMALPGNTVVASGQAIPVGPDQRFSAQVMAPATGALVIRVVRGEQTSVFLRRPRGATP